jgi:hypothetical protein
VVQGGDYFTPSVGNFGVEPLPCQLNSVHTFPKRILSVWSVEDLDPEVKLVSYRPISASGKVKCREKYFAQ